MAFSLYIAKHDYSCFSLFYLTFKRYNVEEKLRFKMLRLVQIVQISVILSHLEVVCRGSETQLQVGENLNDLT